MRLAPQRLDDLSPARRQELLRRSLEDVSDVYERVRGILDDIRRTGDAANLAEHRRLKPDLTAAELKVTPAEIAAAYQQVPAEIVAALKSAAANIRAFHAAQLERPQWQMEVASGILAGRK
ncbi:MAG: histidinol dehydrogenase, partial [Desulfarculus sp.]|nr:histidinol dehydrogenase [Desulfarculus sp.]